MSTMIETKDLTFTYPAPEGETNPPALRGVSVTVEKGTFVVVLGHNGSGKSTLAKHMNAVLLPSGGAVYVEGMDTRDESLLLEIRRRTGMVFQNPDNQIVAKSSASPSPASSPWSRSALCWTRPRLCWTPPDAVRCWTLSTA